MSVAGAASPPAPEADRPGRVVAVDAAKGISILLVVLLHLGSFWQINVFMDHVRMPLFFFTAGLFAAKALSMDTPDFLKQKVGNLFYIYAMWVALHFAVKFVPANILSGAPLLDNAPTLLEAISPVGVLWFVYALGLAYLIGKIAVRFNRAAVLAASFAAYCFAFSVDFGQEDFIILKIFKLFIFFIVAVYYSAEIREFLSSHARFWPVLAVFYLAGRYVLFRYPSLEIGPVPFALSAMGISSVFMFCYRFSRAKAVWLLAAIGSISLSLYLLHGPVIFYLGLALEAVSIEKTELIAFFALPFVVLACWLIGTCLIQRHLNFLYYAPWLPRSTSARSTATNENAGPSPWSGETKGEFEETIQEPWPADRIEAVGLLPDRSLQGS